MIRKKKLSTIIILILFISIGYAVLSTNLSITGLSKFKKNTWSVHFENITDKSLNTTENYLSAVLSEDRKSIEFELSLENPGESYAFFTDIVNEGTLDAMLDSVEVEGIPDELKNAIGIQVSYLDGVELTQYDLLRKNTRETIKVEALFKDSSEIEIRDLPTMDYDLTLTLTINYLQADENAQVRENGVEDEELPIITKLNTTVDANTILAKIDSYDNYSGITKYYFSKDGGTTFVESTSPNYTFTSLDDGDYEIVAYVEDVTGNKSARTTNTVPVYAIYAVLYNDGTLVFNSSGNVDSSKTIEENYGNITKSDYDYYTVPWQANNGASKITKVNIENTIKPLSTASWFSLYRLTEIGNIENLDTSNVTDMNHMFSGCSALETLNVSHFNTSKVTDMSGMFAYDTKLVSLDLSNFNTSNVTTMKEMFSNNAVNTLNLSSFDTSKVTDIDSMFYQMPNIESLDLSNFDTSNITNMGYIFYYSKKLKTLNISTWNTSKVTNMHGMFLNTSSLESLDLNSWDVSNVEDMGDMFGSNTNLIHLNISNWNTRKVKSTAYMFTSDTSLTSLDLSGWNVSNVTDMSHMFYATKSLTSLNISGWNVSKVKNMRGIFSLAENLVSLDISNWNVSNVTDMGYMFYECKALENLNIYRWNTSKVNDMGDIFNGTSRLTTLDISNWDVSNVQNLRGIFSNMSNLVSLDISNWNVSNVQNMGQVFYECSKLNGLDLSKWNTKNVTSFYDMFNNTSQNATSKVWYYGPNSTSLYDNLNQSSNVYATLTYKSN